MVGTTPGYPAAHHEERFSSIVTPALDPLFWPLSRPGVSSAWVTHVPFAHWIVATHRPAMLVELGTHNGVSYSAFCEAVQRAQVDCCCLAFDTWMGDEHSGTYGEDVYADFKSFHDARYGGFSHLTRCTFDAGAQYVADGSVDLLHIDGLHTYEAVLHDFRTWEPKLSKRAIVMFHDINERARGFGVWNVWNELRILYPSFTFLHGHGLGVLAVGPSQVREVQALTALSDSRANIVRNRFSMLGERWHGDMANHELTRHAANLDMLRNAEAGRAANLSAEVAALEMALRDKTEQLDLATSKAASLETEFTRVSADTAELGQIRIALKDQTRQLEAVEAKAATLKQEFTVAKAGRAQMERSQAALQDQVQAAEQEARDMRARSQHLDELLTELLVELASPKAPSVPAL